MLLTEVRTVWGRNREVRSLPVMEEHFDVLFVPFDAATHLEADRPWGIYDRQRRLIEASGYHRGQHREKVSGGVLGPLDIASCPEAPLEHYVYGGAVINHFGHFLITSLARLWFLRFQERYSPVLCHSHGRIEEWFALPYRTALWQGLGLDACAFATFDRLTRIRHLSIPRVALEEQNYVHTVFGQMCRDIGDKLLGEAAIVPSDTPIYLSKHMMGGGVTKIGNESEMVEVLDAEGVRIVCPETLSIADQIRLFREHRVVLGTSTSAFHMSVFSGVRNSITCLLPSDLLNSNFLLVDAVAGNASRYLFPWSNQAQPVRAEGFNAYSVIDNPRAVAQELLLRSRQG